MDTEHVGSIEKIVKLRNTSISVLNKHIWRKVDLEKMSINDKLKNKMENDKKLYFRTLSTIVYLRDLT